MSEFMQNHVSRATTPDCGQGNPDISGIGVRLSFYLQTFLLVLLVTRSWEDAPGALWTFTATSFGLTIGAIVQAAQGQLSFFQALQVSNLVWLANFCTFLAVASYSKCKDKQEEENQRLAQNGSGANEQAALLERAAPQQSRSRPSNITMMKQVISQTLFSVKGAVIFQVLFSMALTLVTWARPSIFSNGSEGSQSTCDVVYVAFFAKELPARESGRILALVFTPILLLGYLGTTLHELRSSYLRRQRKEKKMQKKQGKPTCSTGATKKELKQKGGKIASRWDPMLLGIAVTQFVISTYFIACIELLLVRNPASDKANKAWSFGQILALLAVVPSLVSVYQAFCKYGFGDRRVKDPAQDSSPA